MEHVHNLRSTHTYWLVATEISGIMDAFSTIQVPDKFGEEMQKWCLVCINIERRSKPSDYRSGWVRQYIAFLTVSFFGLVQAEKGHKSARPQAMSKIPQDAQNILGPTQLASRHHFCDFFISHKTKKVTSSQFFCQLADVVTFGSFFKLRHLCLVSVKQSSMPADPAS